MSEFKGTPGPWAVNIIGDHWNNPGLKHIEVTFSEDGECVCDTVYQIEDANLIAAAPELLEALQEVIAAMKITLRVGHERIIELGGQCDSPEMMIKGHSEIARAELVIAKALGK